MKFISYFSIFITLLVGILCFVSIYVEYETFISGPSNLLTFEFLFLWLYFIVMIGISVTLLKKLKLMFLAILVYAILISYSALYSTNLKSDGLIIHFFLILFYTTVGIVNFRKLN
jgi:hypothetical protein